MGDLPQNITSVPITMDLYFFYSYWYIAIVTMDSEDPRRSLRYNDTP